MTSRIINSKVNAILGKLSEITLPIKIEDIARLEGLKIMPYPLESDVSGVLLIQEDGQGIIGYNQNESRVRRRFTIAHELGHYILHKDESHLFVDKEFKIYRSNTIRQILTR
jgi:Zn-dependent peptidase ImmA (M78 family)